MKIFAISDFHISTRNEKPMDVFGEVWSDHLEKIKADWQSKVDDDDVVLIAGDLSWAMRLEEALHDLEFIFSLKGKKVIIKGNHDYWWSGISALRTTLPSDVFALQNDAVRIENTVILGTRGWTPPEDGKHKSAEDEKIYNRELIRLELAIKHAKSLRQEGDKVIAMLHYPPFNSRMQANELTNMLEEGGVDMVVFGHLHCYDKNTVLSFETKGIKYFLTSCDMLQNKLLQIM